MMKTIALADMGDTGMAPYGTRPTLESFGYFVGWHGIGRPRHLMDVLSGKTPCAYDCILLSCHGDDDGKIIMPFMHEELYEPDEPRGNFGFDEVSRCITLKNTLIINDGCSTGNEALVKAFTQNGNTYIAPIDDPEGNSALMFVHLFFYHAHYNGFNINDAYKKASGLDEETAMFRLFRGD
jgi:hypothetical protein